MKVLITGITGFIGSRVVKKFADNDWQIAGLVRPARKDESKLLYEYDGSFSSVNRAIEKFIPDVIIHLAATYSNNVSECIDSLVSVNVSLPLFLLEASKNRTIKMIFAGSYWQFGNRGDSSPIDIYSVSKTAADHLIEYYALRENVLAVILYFYGTYGSNDERGKILDYILRSIATDKKLKLSPGDQKLNLVHVDDVVSALQTVVMNDDLISGKVHKFGVFSDNSYTLKEIISICREYYHHPVNVEFGAVPYRERELMEPQYPYPTVPDWIERVMLKSFIKNFLVKKE